MNERIPDPVRGEDILPWAKSVTDICRRVGSVGSPRSLTRDGSGGSGSEPLPENLRARIRHRPFEVAGSGGDDYKFAIYVPDNVVSIGEEIVEPQGITAIEDTDCWYAIDEGSEVGTSTSVLFLAALADGSAYFTFDPVGAAEENDTEILAILPIAELKTQSVGQKTFGVVVRQLACHPFSVSASSDDGEEVATDDLSVDALGGAGANELELLEFQTKNPETETLARSLVQQSDADRQYVERGEGGNNKKVVKYRKQGYFYAGQNTNITFTPDGNGNVAIQVYYV